jgi:hypothetical protein
LLRSIDQSDDTDEEPSGSQEQTVLNCVPPEASADAFAPEEVTPPPQKPRFGRKKRHKTTAEALFNLSIELGHLQPNAMSWKSRSNDKGDSTDRLFRGAANIMKRHKRSEDATHNDSNPLNHERLHKFASWNRNSQYENGEVDGSHSHDKPVRRRGKPWLRFRSQYKDFEDWFSHARNDGIHFVKVVLSVMLISTFVASILFYVAGNPPCGRDNSMCMTYQANSTISEEEDVDILDTEALLSLFYKASASWWIIWLVRNLVTFSLAKATQKFVIDYLALRSRIVVWLFGPLVTLFIVQAKGWPLLVFFWSVYGFAFLYGHGPFPNHWLYWQDSIDMVSDLQPISCPERSTCYYFR